jgi:hypothetical protein
MLTTGRTLLVLALAALASTARAGEGGGLDLSLHGGGDQYDAVGLRSGLGGLSRSTRLRDVSTHLGATAILRSGMGELGAIGEVGRPGKGDATTLLGALLGLGFDLGGLRFEALGELGGHRYGDVLHDAAVVTRSHSEAWLVSAGVRPGLSVRFGPDRALLLGVWGFARWDVTHRDVQVSLASGGDSTYRLGGSQYGASLRLGISL